MPLAGSGAQSHLKVQHVQRSQHASHSFRLVHPFLWPSLSAAPSAPAPSGHRVSLRLFHLCLGRVLFAQLSLFILLKALANTHALERLTSSHTHKVWTVHQK